MANNKKYDVFISYAIEDKFPVAETIAICLKEKGIKAWYGGNELKVGDSVSAVINEGLRNSNYFIFILSPSYIRNWTIVELYTFVEKERQQKKKLILPVWHTISFEEAKQNHPIISDLFGISTDYGLEAVCQNLYEAILKRKKEDHTQRLKLISQRTFYFLLCFTAIFFIYKNYSCSTLPLPSKQSVQSEIKKRTAAFQLNLENELQKRLIIEKGNPVPVDSVISAYNIFLTTSNHKRNDFRFESEAINISGIKNIEALGINIIDAPYNNYGLSTVAAYSFTYENRFIPDTVFNYSFMLINLLPLTFTIDTLYESGEKVHAHVTYKQNIRTIDGTYSYKIKTGTLRKQQIQLTGHKPSEEYIFELKNGSWNICEVK